MKRVRCALTALLLCLLLTGCRKEAPLENPVAIFTMLDGRTMRFELHLEAAPNTVADFAYLANRGFYDGLEFFRIIPGVLVQSGCPNNDGSGNAGYTIKGEFAANGVNNPLSHTRGTLSMARRSGDANYDTASSQFFIMQGSYPEYDGQYAAFGTPLDDETLDTLDAIANRAVDSNQVPLERVRISTVRVTGHDLNLTLYNEPIE